MKLQALCLLLPWVLTTACAEVDATDESLAETESDLSTADWSPTGIYGSSMYGAQVATLNGTTYMVHSGFADKYMYWRKRTGPHSWSAPTYIYGQLTSDQVSLAAFNGRLYMLHVGETDTSAVWFSSFDPVSERWTTNKKLAMSTSIGAPALAVFDERLWIVGATEIDDLGNNQLWVSTMSTGEVITPVVNLTRKLTSTRVSLAAFANKLYMAFGSGSSIMTMTHTAGTSVNTWSGMSAVKAGPSATTSQGYDPKLAVAGGYLHLVHTRPGGSSTWWTYWNQCTWAPEVQFDQIVTDHPPSLTSGGPGLILTREGFWHTDNFGGYSYRIFGTEYAAPPPPMALPQCGGTVGT